MSEIVLNCDAVTDGTIRLRVVTLLTDSTKHPHILILTILSHARENTLIACLRSEQVVSTIRSSTNLLLTVVGAKNISYTVTYQLNR